jgi:hypothetical protein
VTVGGPKNGQKMTLPQHWIGMIVEKSQIYELLAF